MEKEKEIKNIYIDIDSLFDTRLALLFSINKKVANKVYKDDYYTRDIDEFDTIPYSFFNAVYRKRNKHLLSIAPPTNIYPVLINIYNNIKSDAKHINTDLKLYLNVYPYNLLEEEINNISIILKNYLPDIEIIAINKSIDKLTPEWFGNNVENIFMYSGLDWINYHMSTNKLIKFPLMDKIMYIPKLRYGKLKEKETIASITNKLIDQLSFVINILPIEVRTFSSVEYTKENSEE